MNTLDVPRLTLTGCGWHQVEYLLIGRVSVNMLREAKIHETRAEELLEELIQPLVGSDLYKHLWNRNGDGSPCVCKTQMAEILQFLIYEAGGNHLDLMEALQGMKFHMDPNVEKHLARCGPCRNYVGYIKSQRPAVEDLRLIQNPNAKRYER